MAARQAIGSSSGQGTVEWVGLVTLVLALFVAVGIAGVRIPGAGLAVAIVNRIECALGERSLCGPSSPQPALARVYGAELAAEVRTHAPEVDYESGMSALPVDFRSCRGPVCGNGPSSGAVWLSDTGSRAVSFVHVVDCRSGHPHLIDRPAICSGPLRGNLYIQYWLYYEDSSSLRDLQPILDPLGAGALHQDDWESYQVRIGADGELASRASSHNSYISDGRGRRSHRMPRGQLLSRFRTVLMTAGIGLSQGFRAQSVPAPALATAPGAGDQREISFASTGREVPPPTRCWPPASHPDSRRGAAYFCAEGDSVRCPGAR